MQIWVGAGKGDPGTFADISASVYNRSGLGDMYGVPLTRLNKDWITSPGGAKSWSVGEDGVTWTFVLDDGFPWSDGSGNLNADDFVTTARHMADPKTGYDFTWYYSKGSGNILNFDEVVGGKAKLEDLGVTKGANDYELIIKTSEPTPYLPSLFGFYMPLNGKALAAHGPAYNTDPKTAVSSGPFIVSEWTPTRMEAKINTKAGKSIMPFLERVIFVPFPNAFQAYQAGTIDSAAPTNSAELETVLNDETLSAQAATDPGDFRTDYFFFDTRKEPFSNKKFRQAIAHLLDRDSIIKSVIKPVLGRPAYSMLAPGYPAANGEAYKKYQEYNPELAKQLFTESGLDAAKIGKLTLTNRGEATDALRMGMCQAFADAIKQNLGIEVEIQAVVQKDFMAKLLAKDGDQAAKDTIDFGRIDYGMDYLDPSNMLTVLKSGGRHTWNNKEYDDLLAKAGPMTNIEERTKIYQQAEELMVEDAAFIWAVHRTNVALYKPYLKGSFMEPGKVNTAVGITWPGFSMISTAPETIYIGKEVETLRPSIP
ncbi:MAG: peptide ABC transporter substrate-binding protein [Chloroflexi bacterium]|nr:peptide ABC transporter substrate-binding protein [Chloroflexota bacterium]